jgi:hypothetical protein
VSDIPKAKDEFEKCVLMCSANAPSKLSEHNKNGMKIFIGGCYVEMACAAMFLQC